MNRVYSALLLSWLCWGACQTTAAIEIAPYARALADPATQKATLEQLQELAEPMLRPVLLALQEGALYQWQEQLLIFTAEGIFKKLDGSTLLDTAGHPLVPDSGLEPVPLAAANSAVLQRTLDVIQLFAADPPTRAATALRFGNIRDKALLPILQKAQQAEQNPQVRQALEASLTKLQLADPDPQLRLQAIAYFRATYAEAALSSLRAIQQHDPDVTVQAAATAAIRAIERYLTLRNSIGYVFNGLSLASILLLMSLGLAITFGLMGIINMAHGEMLMLGSYTAYILQELFAAYLPGAQNFAFLLALPCAIVLVGGVGVLIERGLLRWLYGRPLESLLVTWGLGMVLQQGARLVFGDQTSVSPPSWFRGGWEILPGLIFPYSRLFIIALSLLALIAVYLLLYRSDTGLTVRAVMQNRGMASCMGIAARRVDALTFALGTALAGLAGCALSLIGTVDPEVGKTYIVDSFMVVVLGGVGKLMGAVLASFGVGMANKLLEPAIGGTAAAVYAKVAILGLVILFLQRKPTGLFPAKERTSTGLAH